MILQVFHLVQNTSCHAYAICRGLLQTSGDGGAVSDCPQSPDTGFKVSVYHHLIGVEFNLNTVEQSFVAGNAGSYLVQCQKHFLDIRHDAVGNTRDRSPGTASFRVGIRLLRQRRSSVVRRPLEVTEGLNHNSSSAEHVGQLGNVLAVFNGFVEGFGKVLAYQKGKVGVVCLILLGFVRMAVYHCKAVFVIFCGHLPEGLVQKVRTLSSKVGV